MGEIVHFFYRLRKSLRAIGEIFSSMTVKATTQSLGSPKTFILGISVSFLAQVSVALMILFAFYLKPFFVIWVKEYQAAAEAKPGLEPEIVGVS